MKRASYIQHFLLGLMTLLGCGQRTDSQLPGGQSRGGRSAQATVDQGPLFPVSDGNRWGFIDGSGKLVLDLKYCGVTEFSDGRAFAATQTPEHFVRWDLIDRTGKVLVAGVGEPRFSGGLYEGFSEGVAATNGWAEVRGEWHYTEADGSMFGTSPSARKAHGFRGGRAAVWVGDQWGYIDHTGMFVIKPQFSQPGVDYGMDFSAGLACVPIGSKFGFIDTAGNMVIEPAFDYGGYFSEGLAPVESNGRWGYIDGTGRWVIAPGFVYALSFSEGLAAVAAADGKYGYVYRSGQYAIPPRFDEAHDFSEGLACVFVGDWAGYVDNRGTLIVAPQFKYGGPFRNGRALVGLSEASGVFGVYTYVDKTGKVIWKPN